MKPPVGTRSISVRALDQLRDAQLAVQDDMERVGGIALSEEDGATVESSLGAASGQPRRSPSARDAKMGTSRSSFGVIRAAAAHGSSPSPAPSPAALDVILAEILMDEGDGDRTFAQRRRRRA